MTERISLASLQKPWSEDFTREVEAGNFLRGGTSLFLSGPKIEDELYKWHRCFMLANIPSYLTTPTEIQRRMNGQYIPRDNEERVADFEKAETLIIRDLFAPETQMKKNSVYDFVWFLKEAIRDGIVIVIATDDTDPDLNTYGDDLGALIEKHFEVIQHGPSSKKSKKPSASNK